MIQFPNEFEECDGVWQPCDRSNLTPYSDGDDVELRLAEILKAATDRSADSVELSRRIDDWPSRYYLSPERANLLRSLELRPDASVLELGCGCGALTRWLGENVAHVTAVEGSARRASVTRLRCADLQSVRVVSGNFNDVEWDRKFDVVTLIGVLEYAALHDPDAEDPFAATLAAARQALAPGGVLIVAIENALGIKYLSGCGEDHGLRPYAGVEGYPNGGGPRTFAREELSQKLGRTGLTSIQCLLPFPDYKIPTTLLNGERATADECRALSLSDWCRQSFDQYDAERDHAFADHLALRQFANNGLLADVSNSFLMIATERPRNVDSPVPPIDWIARRYNVLRRAEYRTAVTLRRVEGEARILKGSIGSRRLGPRDPQQRTDPQDSTVGLQLTNRAAVDVPYLENAPTLAMRALQALRQDQPETAFGLCLQAWIEFLEQSSPDALASGTLAGSFLDCTLDNLLIHEDRGLVYVDDEWEWADPVPVDWLLYRGLLSFWFSHHPWVSRALKVDDALSFFRRALKLVGLQIDSARILKLQALEQDLQRRVNGDNALGQGRNPRRSESSETIDGATLDWAPIAARLVREFQPSTLRIVGTPPMELMAALQSHPLEIFLDTQTANEPTATGSSFDLGLWFAKPDDNRTEAVEFLNDCRETIYCPASIGSSNLEIEPVDGATLKLFRPAPETDVSYVAPRATLWRKECLKITILSPGTDLHGGTLVIFRHANGLAARGHRVTVASPSRQAPDWIELSPGVRHLSVPTAFDALLHALPAADALVATLWTTAPIARMADPSKGKKFYLVQAYESAWAGEPDDVDDTYRLPLRKLCVSSWLQEILHDTYGEASDWVPNGTDFANSGPAPGRVSERDPKRKLRIGMLFHLSPVKGTADGLKAFSIAQAELGDRAELVLYGTQRPDGLDRSIEFHENPTRHQLATVLGSLDAFISPSLSEGFGLPALEAMAVGTATILTDSGGCRDYARDGAVLLSPPGNPKALAANLLKVCRDDGLRRRLAAKGAEVAGVFTWARASDSLESAVSAELRTVQDPLHVVYVAAGPCWFDTYLDPWMLRAFRSLGHQVTEFHPRPQDFRYQSRFVNPQLLDSERRRAHARGDGQRPSELPAFVRRHKPDLVFINHGLLIPGSVLDDLRKMGAPTAGWMMDEPQEVYYSANRGQLLDYVFLQDLGSLRRHRKIGNPRTFHLPHGVDPVDHRRRNGNPVSPEHLSDVLLIGTGFPGRREWIRQLAGLDCRIRVIGRGWEDLHLPNVQVRNTPVTAEEAGHYYRGAKMTLNLHRGQNDMASGSDIPKPLSPNGSFFHISGCESLQLVDERYPGASDYLVPGRQFATFRDGDELKSTIEFYLSNEDVRREAAEDAAWTLHRHHSYAEQLKRGLEATGRPRSHRRLFGLSRGARGDCEVFDKNGAAPIASILLHVGADVKTLQRSLLGVAAGHRDPNDIVVYHGVDAETDRWLDQRTIPHVVTAGTGPASILRDALQRVDGEVLIYVHESVLVTTHLYRRLVSILEEDRTIGLLSPAIHPAGGNQSIELQYTSLEELTQVSRRLLLNHRGHFSDHPSPEPVCFAIRRQALEQAGGFDPRFADGTLELTDLCERLRSSGWKTGWTRSALVHRLDPPRVVPDEAIAQAQGLLRSKLYGDAVEIPTPQPARVSDR